MNKEYDSGKAAGSPKKIYAGRALVAAGFGLVLFFGFRTVMSAAGMARLEPVKLGAESVSEAGGERGAADYFIGRVVRFGPAVLGVTLFLTALGTPFPGTVLMLAAGAFCRRGVLDCRWIVLFGILGTAAGDSAAFFLGRLGGKRVRKRIVESASWRSARAYFKRYGWTAIFLTRWFVLPLAVPINYIAGGAGCSFPKFLSAAIPGEFLWLITYGGLGFVFGGGWKSIGAALTDLGGFLTGLVLLVLGIRLLKNSRTSGKEIPVSPGG